MIVFLGILIDGKLHVLAVPQEKKVMALNLLQNISSKKSVKVRKLQSLAGLLNFLHRAIVPGRAFTRHMYAKFSRIFDRFGNRLPSSHIKAHHHVRIDAEFIKDCELWINFLKLQDSNRSLLCRPFVDFSPTATPAAETLPFYTDVAKGEFLGMGGVYDSHWYFAQWEPNYIRTCDPSIEYLELLAISMGFFLWGKHLQHRHIIVHCDNQSVVSMVNSTTSSCPNCMVLIRKLVLKSLEMNTRIFCKWIVGAQNFRADFLSRQRISEFRKYVTKHNIITDEYPTTLHSELWPASKLWVKTKQSRHKN